MVAQRTQYSTSYAEQIREIDCGLKSQNSSLPAFAAVGLLLAGIALLALMGKNFDFPGSRTRAGLGALLFVLFVLWEIREYRKSKRFAACFYGEMLPNVLKRAYAAYIPRIDDPDPLFFDPAEDWRFPTTVTFLVLSMGGFSFRAQGIYRIQRKYFEKNGLGDKNNESGEYHISQDLIWKVQTREHIPFRLSIHTASGTVKDAVFGMFGKICDRLIKNGMQDVKTDNESLNRDFRIRADDVPKAESFLDTHWQRLTELRDSMGQFSLEYADNMLTLSFSDFAPVDTKDTYNVRCTGLPKELSAERVGESAKKLDFLSDWLEHFCGKAK